MSEAPIPICPSCYRPDSVVEIEEHGITWYECQECGHTWEE